MADFEGSRFVMPQLTVQVEGRGNGLKTVLVNGYDIGRALHRSGPEIVKFIGYAVASTPLAVWQCIQIVNEVLAAEWNLAPNLIVMIPANDSQSIDRTRWTICNDCWSSTLRTS